MHYIKRARIYDVEKFVFHSSHTEYTVKSCKIVGASRILPSKNTLQNFQKYPPTHAHARFLNKKCVHFGQIVHGLLLIKNRV